MLTCNVSPLSDPKVELAESEREHELGFHTNVFDFLVLPWISERKVNGKDWVYTGMAAAWETITNLFLNC